MINNADKNDILKYTYNGKHKSILKHSKTTLY